MRTLIVSADDFGLTASVNEGIVRACAEGIVTCPQLLPTGEAFDGAVKLARSAGITEVGAHLALTQTAPLSVQNKIPTLLGKGGAFRASYIDLVRALYLGRIDLDQAYVELRNQIAAVVSTGFAVTTLSSHEHIHMMGAFREIFVKLALEYDIPFVRCPRRETPVRPFTAAKFCKNVILSRFGPAVARTLREAGVRSTDHFIGLLDSGEMVEDRLVEHILSLRTGTTELVTHPGFIGPEVVRQFPFHRNGEAELFGLTGKRVRRALEERGVTLRPFSGAGER